MLIGLFGFTTSTGSFACLAAIEFMPIGDIIVVCFTSPVFSVFLDRIVLKRPLSFISISLCLCIVLGDAFIVQPSFLFGDRYGRNQSSNSLENVKDQVSLEKQGKLYYNGVALCFYASAAMAVANVVSTYCYKKQVTTSNIMLVSGFSSFLLSMISAFFLPNRVLTAPLSLSMESMLLLPVSAVISMIAYWTLTLAVSITRHPTLVSMLRSTEILISLGTESLWWGQHPGNLSLFGSLLVTACILGMAGQDKISSVLDTVRTTFWARKEDISNSGNTLSQTDKLDDRKRCINCMMK